MSSRDWPALDRTDIRRRGLRWDEHEVGGEKRGAHEPRDARRPVDDEMMGVARELRRLPMKRVAGKADDAEEPRQSFFCALLRPVERRALCVGIDQDDALASRAHCPARCSASVVLPTPPF